MTTFDLSKTGTDPLELFYQWFHEAKSSEPADPDAACLSTVGPDGQPSSRVVLIRRVDQRGFAFFTNGESRKGRELKSHPKAALCYHWKSLGRQVRVEGAVETVADEESDDYFANRPRGSRIGAWASAQSEPLESREALLKKLADAEKTFEGQHNVPRPPYWHGFRIIPARIEFWQNGEFRLHDRFVFTRDANGAWTSQRLNP